MDPNQNPPSDREWTQEEMEEFFSAKYEDAITYAVTNGVPGSSHTAPLTLEALMKMKAEVDATFPRPIPLSGIHITAIVPPESGWPMAYYCPICRETTFMLSPWGIKPSDGDFFLMKNTCASNNRHTVKLQVIDKPPVNEFHAEIRDILDAGKATKVIHEYENVDGEIHHRIFPSKEELGPEGVEKVTKIANRLLSGNEEEKEPE